MDNFSVLIADDDDMIRKLLSRICQEMKWNCMEAKDGDEAIGLLEEHDFQIGILDVKMPGPSGVELAQRIMRKDPTIAILILTGFAEIEEAVEAIKEGVFDYVQKHQMEAKALEQKLKRAAEFHKNRIIQHQSQKERERTLQDLERANKEFQAILHLSNDLIFTINARSGEIMDCNQAACLQLNYTREALLSLPLQEIVAEYRGMKWHEIYQKVLLNKSRILERTLLGKNQEMFPVDLSYAYVCLETGEYFALIARDISERKSNERKLQEHQQALESQAAILSSIVNNIDEGVILADKDDQIIEINQWILDWMQTPKEFLINRPLKNLIMETFGIDIYSTLYELKHEESEGKCVLYGDVGDVRCMINVQAIYKNNEYHGVILNCHDISSLVEEQKKAEKETHQQRERLRNMSSDFQTPIYGIVEISKQLMDTHLEQNQRLMTEMIHDFGGTLSTLIESRLEKTEKESIT